MIITHINKPGDAYNKVAAIKAVRAYNRMGLKEAKEAIEKAYDTGSVDIPNGDGNIIQLRQDLAYAGGFSVATSEAELFIKLEECIKLAVDVRAYKTARGLINLLPRDMRKEFGEIVP